jgi:hypothetical protein
MGNEIYGFNIWGLNFLYNLAKKHNKELVINHLYFTLFEKKETLNICIMQQKKIVKI